MRAATADCHVVTCGYSCHRVNVLAENPDLKHLAGLAIACLGRQDHDKRLTVDRRLATLKNVAGINVLLHDQYMR